MAIYWESQKETKQDRIKVLGEKYALKVQKGGIYEIERGN